MQLISKLINDGYKAYYNADDLADAVANKSRQSRMLVPVVREVQRKMPGIVALHHVAGQQIHFAYPDDHVPRCRLSATASYRSDEGYIDVYNIQSKDIRIGRYQDQDYKETKNVDTAIRHVCRHAKEIPLLEVYADKFHDAVRIAPRKVADTLKSKIHKTIEAMFPACNIYGIKDFERKEFQDFITEMSLLASSYEPRTPAFRDNLPVLLDLWAEYQAESSRGKRNVQGWFVITSSPLVKNEYCQVLRVDASKYNAIESAGLNDTEDGTLYYPHNVPDEISNKVARLMILEAGDYIADVGLRLDDNAFYIPDNEYGNE